MLMAPQGQLLVRRAIGYAKQDSPSEREVWSKYAQHAPGARRPAVRL